MKYLKLLLLSLLATTNSYANIGLYPHSITFSKDSSKALSISIFNKSNKAHTYRVDMVEQIMTENRGLRRLKSSEGTEYDASKIIKFSPKRIKLNPTEQGIIRLRLRKNNKIKSGEYRAYLRVSQEPKGNKESRGYSGNKYKKRHYQSEIEQLYSFSIPVAVKHGDLNYKIKAYDLRIKNGYIKKIKKKTKIVQFKMIRTGNESSTSHIKFIFKDVSGKETVLHRKKMYQIYFPTKKINSKFQLRIPKKLEGKKGKIIIEFKSMDKRSWGKLQARLTQNISL
jgi:fimbrial chaperone protein